MMWVPIDKSILFAGADLCIVTTLPPPAAFRFCFA